jgi:hypothetical protein
MRARTIEAVTLSDWLDAALKDADRRGLPALRPLLEGLARSTDALRASEWNTDARDSAPRGPSDHPDVR